MSIDRQMKLHKQVEQIGQMVERIEGLVSTRDLLILTPEMIGVSSVAIPLYYGSMGDGSVVVSSECGIEERVCRLPYAYIGEKTQVDLVAMAERQESDMLDLLNRAIRGKSDLSLWQHVKHWWRRNER
jgi:hypothetical protein